MTMIVSGSGLVEFIYLVHSLHLSISYNFPWWEFRLIHTTVHQHSPNTHTHTHNTFCYLCLVSISNSILGLFDLYKYIHEWVYVRARARACQCKQRNWICIYIWTRIDRKLVNQSYTNTQCTSTTNYVFSILIQLIE